MEIKWLKGPGTQNANVQIFFQQWKKTLLRFVLPLVIGIFILYGIFGYIIMREQTNLLKVNCAKSTFTIDNLFKELYSSYQILLMEDETFDFISAPEGTLYQPSSSSIPLSVAQSLTRFARNDSFVESVYLHSFSHNYTITSNGSSYTNSFHDSIAYDYFRDTGESFFVLPEYAISNYASPCLTVGYAIDYYASPAGLLVFKLNTNNIDKLINPDLSSYLSSMYMIGKDGQVLYASNDDTSTMITKDHTLFRAYSEADRDTLNIVRNQGDLFASQSLSNGITIVFCANNAYFSRHNQLTRSAVVVCLLLVFILSLSMSANTTSMYYRTICNVVSALNVDNNTPHFEDTKQIVHHIMDIVSKNEKFEDALVKNIQQLKLTQSLALQYQFDPHFLFNTLNSINLLVAEYAGINNEASKAIVSLASLMRTSMDTSDYILTLGEELEYEKKYIEMQQILNENAFHLVMDIDSDTLDCKVIKLMLQPIIENAFIYGAKACLSDESKTHNIYLSISSHIVNKGLQITVKNNGSGITSEKLEELRSSLEENDILHSKHIGLNNVHQRIKLLFGAEYGCALDADEECFSVTLNLPLSQ